ncbi:mercuric transport protein MerTP [Maribacter antarcticus]|uniref:mercuric transport protein MerTP n=1 Tax=Maribacter antarcticus TaxID=505250 RepID=UPI000478AA69|nr:mercuric transport protein MerTP [Maribacter antarcticus]
MDINSKLVGTSVFAAITASLCCVAPVLALVAGTTGAASTFSWVEPFRPYLIGLTVLILTLAWYTKLKPKSQEEINCPCEDKKPKFINTKKFLLLVSIFAGIMLAFPFYSSVFYPNPPIAKEIIFVELSNVREIKVDIEGMTCKGCEAHIESEVNKLSGILTVDANYETANTIVKFDESEVKIKAIEKAISDTGYKIIK